MSSSGDLFKLVGRILIENADALEAISETTKSAQGLAETLQGTGGEADNASKHMGSSSKLGSASVWMGNMFTKLTEKGIAFGKFIGKTGFGFDANMEAYRNQFESLLGDADKASKLVDDLQLLAKVSPLGMEGLANNAVSLLNSGTQLKDIIPTLEMLGNLALGDTNKMNSIVRAYTQILSKGQLMAQEMYQLGDAGVPIREIMTLYGGPEYEDGSWYQKKLKDPTYSIFAEEMVAAFQGATAEGGKWHNYMFQMMDTWLGQTDRMGEEGKESLGAFMLPFFEIAKSNVLPRISESLAGFGTWVSENQGTLEKMADAVGKLVTGGFDSMINAFTWMMENGTAVSVALGTIATALTIGAIAAHPYATAIMAVAAGLALLTARNADGDAYNHFFNKFSDEELQTLQNYVDAVNRYREAEASLVQDESNQTLIDNFIAAGNAMEEASRKASAIDGLIAAYDAWRSGQAENAGKDLYLDVPMRAADDAQASLQSEVDGYDIESVVTMLADTSGLQAAVNATNLTAHVDLTSGGVGTGSRWISNLPGHASGLDDVPYDNYIARLHKGEAVLNSTNAEAWRSGGMGNTGRLESMMAQMMTVMQQVAANTAGGKQIVLDSGVLVGQLAPALDTQLGTISSRKGRRN